MNKLEMIFPCKVDWETMAQREAGRYCKECKKVISDYTQSRLDDLKSEVFCGRFTSDQINYHKSEYEVKNFKALSLSLLGLLSGIPGNDLRAQTNSTDPNPGDSINKEIFKGKFSNLRFPLKMEGTIRDKSSKEVIVNADVRMLQRDSVIYSVKTDSTGKFYFVLLEKDIKDPFFDLRVSYTGTDRPYMADTLLKVPLISDTIKNNVVFSIDFLLKPVEITALAIDPNVIGIPTWDITVLGGAVAYQLPQVPLFDHNAIAATCKVLTDQEPPEVSTIAVSRSIVNDAKSGSAATLNAVAEEKKKQNKLEKPLVNRIWIVLAVLVMAIFLGASRFRNRNN